MRRGYHENGALMRLDVHDGRGYNSDPYNRGPPPFRGYAPHGPPVHSPALPYDGRPQYDDAYNPGPPAYNAPPHRPAGHGPPLPRDYPRQDPRFAAPVSPRRSFYPEEQVPPYNQRPIYPDERNYPSMPYERQPAPYERPSYEHGPPREYPVHSAPRGEYPEQVDTYGRPYPAHLDAQYVDSRGPPVPYPVHGNLPSPSGRPSFQNPSQLPMGYSPRLGYAPNGYDRAPPTFGPPGVHLPDGRPMGSIPVGGHPSYDNHVNVVNRGEIENWNQQREKFQGGVVLNEVARVDHADGRFRERGSVPLSPVADPRVPEVLCPSNDPDDGEDDASSLEEPEQSYEERYEDDDTIATQDATDNGIDFLNLDASKRLGVNLDFSQLETVGEDEPEPEYTPDRIQSKGNPMDPRFWFVLPPPNGISILKGTRFARNSPIENRVSFWQCDVTKVGEADYMYGVPPEVIWWTKAELNNRVIEDDNDRIVNPVAKIYDQECTKAFEKLTDRVKRALDRNRHPRPNIAALWNDAKLAKLIKQPVMAGLSFGFRGIELGGMAGRRLRARGHFEMIKEYTDESNYRTKRRARTARRGGAMGVASEEYTLTIRLWARTVALADQACAHLVSVLDARDQRVHKQVAREQEGVRLVNVLDARDQRVHKQAAREQFEI